MNWKKWMGYNLYKKLWILIGKRPWTYIWRDLWTQAEIMMQALWFLTGVVIYYFFGWWGVIFFWIFYTYGYINGHFFWGTKHIKGQRGE